MTDTNKELLKCLRDYWEHVLRFNPTFATYIGDHRYDDRLADLSEESITRQNKYYRELLVKIENFDESLLTGENRLNLSLIRRTLENHIQFYKFKTRFIPLDHLRGPHIGFPQIIEFHPFQTVKDIENYIARINAFPEHIHQVIETFQKGIQQNITAFTMTMEYVLKQVKTFTRFSPENSPLYSPVVKLGEHFSEKEKNEIKISVREAISSSLSPAYRKLFQYLSKDYVKHCRSTEGIWSLPDGPDLYRFSVEYFTSTDHTPEEIHRIGIDEVERISREIRRVIEKTGFHCSVREFAEHVKTKKGLYPTTRKEILDGFRQLLSRMDEKLPDYFGRLPRARYDIKEIEHYREQAAPAAYYYPPPRDFSRPGYFYVNTYKPEQRPVFVMEALAYHEAVPGHHLQIAVMQEQEHMPDFRRYEGATAFVEGWALYAEKLAKEMGFYRDSFSEYGRLTFEVWRAARLVVDTGIHFLKWSRDKSIQYCRENTGLEAHEIEVEVDRYIAMPGQALAYKMGELKILELRKKAEKAFGSNINLKEFHDRLLEHGALPLSALEAVMNKWTGR